MEIKNLHDRAEPLRVLIVDEHPVVCHGLKAVIDQAPGLVTVGVAATPSDALAVMGQRTPNVVIHDLTFNGASGLDFIRDLGIRGDGCASVVFTGLRAEDYALHCFRAGARGFLAKGESVETLVRAIQLVAGGGMFISERHANLLLGKLNGSGRGVAAPSIDRLSNCEFQVLHLIGRGMDNRRVASALHRSIKTIETYRCRIKQKLGLTNAVELAQYALRHLGNNDGGSIATAQMARQLTSAATNNDTLPAWLVDNGWLKK